MNRVFVALTIILAAWTAAALADGHKEYGGRFREWYERGTYTPGEGHNEVKFYGTIESLPQGGLHGTWIVSGRQVIVTRYTKIEEEHGPVAVGAYVKIEASADSFTAREIEVKGPAGR